MKYEFLKHVGLENLQDEKRLFDRMVQVLTHTKAQVNFHVLPKKKRYFLCPLALVEVDQKGEFQAFLISACHREKLEIKISKDKMIQVIKKALKNYTRQKAQK